MKFKLLSALAIRDRSTGVARATLAAKGLESELARRADSCHGFCKPRARDLFETQALDQCVSSARRTAGGKVTDAWIAAISDDSRPDEVGRVDRSSA